MRWWAVCLFGPAWFPGVVQAQVRNLRFDDIDSGSGTVGGTVYWEQPAAGVSGVEAYSVFFSTSASSGGSETKIGDVLAGAYTSLLTMAGGTSIPTGAQFVLVYLRDSAGNLATGTVAFACLKDLQTGSTSGYARTIYFTTVGYNKAARAKADLSSEFICAAQAHRINIIMVATVNYDSSSVVVTGFDDSTGQNNTCTVTSDCTGSLECTDGYCRSSTAGFLVSLPTDSAFASVISAVDGSGYLASAPVPPFYTGEGTTPSTYSLGVLDVSSVLDGFAPANGDEDIAQYLSKSLVQFNVALAATATRQGELRVVTTSALQTAVNEVANVYMGYRTVAFEDLSAASSTTSALTSYTTGVTQAQCWQVTADHSHASCT